MRDAARRLRGRVDRTPVLTSAAFDEACGYTVYFKCENLQRAGAFKIRGALNKLLTLTAEERRRGVVAFSSGNHAQGVALAARLVGTSAVVCMPTDAPALKLEATRGYGAEVVLYDRQKDDREALARRIAGESGRSSCRRSTTTRSWPGKGPPRSSCSKTCRHSTRWSRPWAAAG